MVLILILSDCCCCCKIMQLLLKPQSAGTHHPHLRLVILLSSYILCPKHLTSSTASWCTISGLSCWWWTTPILSSGIRWSLGTGGSKWNMLVTTNVSQWIWVVSTTHSQCNWVMTLLSSSTSSFGIWLSQHWAIPFSAAVLLVLVLLLINCWSIIIIIILLLPAAQPHPSSFLLILSDLTAMKPCSCSSSSSY